MELIDTRVYTGSNVYSHKTCARFIVDIKGYEETPTNAIINFNAKLIELVPELKKHRCSLGYEGGFCDRLLEGTYLPHVLEHTIIALQNRLGFSEIKYGKARLINDSLYHIVVQYELEEAVLSTFNISLKMFNSLIEGEEFDLETEFVELEKKISRKRLGPSTKSIYDEAIKRNIPVMKIGKDSLLQLGYGKCQKRVEATLTNQTACLAVDISCDKELTNEILKYNNLPVTDGYVANDVIELLISCKKVGYPLVIKPVNGSKGCGVTVNINSENEAIEAYNEAARINKKVIVERFIQGDDYRILVVDGFVVAAAQRVPPSVYGDGEHSIEELINIENKNLNRGYDHEKPLTKIVIDDIMISYLNKKGLDLSFVPLRDEKITLRFNANISTGGEAIDCTDIVHPENIEIAVKAAEAIGLDIAGIDICCSDIRKSLRATGGAILEVNAAPGIRMHLNPSYGKPRDVAKYILDYIYKDSKPSIPIVAITGTNGKTTVTRMIAHIMQTAGLRTGMTTTGGIYINNKRILKGDTTGSESAKMVLMDKSIDAAVLETARGGIIKKGLGYSHADVGVITNISEDHLGLDGINTIEELANVKSLVAEAISRNGYVVLNADDENTKLIVNRVKNKCIYFSMNRENEIVKKCIIKNEICFILDNDYITMYVKGKVNRIIQISEIPAVLGGVLRYNIENALAAAAASYAAGIDIKYIEEGLKCFEADSTYNPGRFNIYTLGNINIIVDYGHNIEAYKAVIDSVNNMNFKRKIGIIGVPGDRSDVSIKKLGAIAADGFDFLYIKEDVDKRGRQNGEVSQLLLKGMPSSFVRKENYDIIENEGEALRKAVDSAILGDVIVIFYENYDLIMKIIWEYKTKLAVVNEVEKVV